MLHLIYDDDDRDDDDNNNDNDDSSVDDDNNDDDNNDNDDYDYVYEMTIIMVNIIDGKHPKKKRHLCPGLT